jgi:predicted RecB family endonuclease
MNPDDKLSDLEQLAAQEAEEDGEALARAKKEAEERGKEPFDLDALDARYDTGSDLARPNASPEPREERRRTWEYKYYVQAREVMTIDEFVALQERLDPHR